MVHTRTVTAPRAMILAAGFGTRLGVLTQQRPKPMLPICGTPLVRWSARWLAHHGVSDIAVNLHHLGEQIQAELGEGDGIGARIHYSHEEGMILGTGGGLRKARDLIDGGDGAPIVVVNGKILVDFDLESLIETHRASGAEATMVLRPDPNATKWGSLQLDDDGRVVRLLQGIPEADPDAEPTSAPLMFTGIHVFEPRFLDRIPPEGEQCIVRTAYRELFHEGRGLHGVVTEDYWWEHSTPERYLQGVANVLDGKARLPHAEHPLRGVSEGASVDPSAEILGPVWVGPGVRIEAGARIGPHVQLGAEVTVESGSVVERAIAWEGAVLSGTVRDAVVPSP